MRFFKGVIERRGSKPQHVYARYQLRKVQGALKAALKKGDMMEAEQLNT